MIVKFLEDYGFYIEGQEAELQQYGLQELINLNIVEPLYDIKPTKTELLLLEIKNELIKMNKKDKPEKKKRGRPRKTLIPDNKMISEILVK